MLLQYLVSPSVQVHDEIVGLRIPVPDLALVAVRIPGHLVRHVAILSMTGEQLVVLLINRNALNVTSMSTNMVQGINHFLSERINLWHELDEGEIKR